MPGGLLLVAIAKPVWYSGLFVWPANLKFFLDESVVETEYVGLLEDLHI